LEVLLAAVSFERNCLSRLSLTSSCLLVGSRWLGRRLDVIRFCLQSLPLPHLPTRLPRRHRKISRRRPNSFVETLHISFVCSTCSCFCFVFRRRLSRDVSSARKPPRPGTSRCSISRTSAGINGSDPPLLGRYRKSFDWPNAVVVFDGRGSSCPSCRSLRSSFRSALKKLGAAS
jgi:hypothetical protein